MNEPFLFQNLSERITELFPEIDSDTTTKLLHTNEEYQKLTKGKKNFWSSALLLQLSCMVTDQYL